MGKVFTEDLGDGPTVSIRCPDCGRVNVPVDAWSDETPVSGLCPECGERLYFEEEPEGQP